MKSLFALLVLSVLSLPLLASEKGMIVATGFGTVDPNAVSTQSQAKMLAKRAARLDAQRQLSEQVNGIEVRAGSTVEDFELTSDIIATRVKSLLRGSMVIEEALTEEEGTWVASVTMGVCVTNESELCEGRETLREITQTTSSVNR